MPGPGIVVQRDWQFSVEKQAAWDTAETGGSPIGLPLEDMPIKLPPGNMTIPHSSGTRSLSEISMYNDSSGVIATATMPVMPVTPQTLTALLPGILQKNEAWEESTDEWTMYPVEVADLPLMRDSDEGYFYTLVRKHPTDAATAERIINAIPTAMKLVVHPTDDNGVLVFKPIEWIGQGYTNSVDIDDTIVQQSLVTLYKWTAIGKFAVDANDMTNDFFSAEIDISYGGKYQGDTINGDGVFPEFTCGGTFTVAKNGNTESMKDLCHTDVVSNAIAIQLDFGDSTVSSLGELNITMYAYLRDYEAAYEDGEQITFTFEGCLASADQDAFRVVYWDNIT